MGDLYRDWQRDLDERAARVAKKLETAYAAIAQIDRQIAGQERTARSLSRRISGAAPRVEHAEKVARQTERLAVASEERASTAEAALQRARGADEQARAAARAEVDAYKQARARADAHNARNWWIAAALIALALVAIGMPIALRHAGMGLKAPVVWAAAVSLAALALTLAVVVAPVDATAVRPPSNERLNAASSSAPSGTTLERQQVAAREADAARGYRQRANTAAARFDARRRALDSRRSDLNDRRRTKRELLRRRKPAARRASMRSAQLAEMRSCDVRTDATGCMSSGDF